MLADVTRRFGLHGSVLSTRPDRPLPISAADSQFMTYLIRSRDRQVRLRRIGVLFATVTSVVGLGVLIASFLLPDSSSLLRILGIVTP